MKDYSLYEKYLKSKIDFKNLNLEVINVSPISENSERIIIEYVLSGILRENIIIDFIEFSKFVKNINLNGDILYYINPKDYSFKKITK